jgi:hypothetical protein
MQGLRNPDMTGGSVVNRIMPASNGTGRIRHRCVIQQMTVETPPAFNPAGGSENFLTTLGTWGRIHHGIGGPAA